MKLTARDQVQLFKLEVYALYFAYKDPRVPCYAKAFTACVVGYVLSPIDLIPDFIPILGCLDDLLRVPFGILAARRRIPDAVLAECRERAHGVIQQAKVVNRTAAVFIVAI